MEKKRRNCENRNDSVTFFFFALMLQNEFLML